MRLIGCHIENFGKLHDYTVDFEKGTHIICEENGWGKSTLAAFIRAMFYGLEGERKRSIEENERKRYMPWQGGVFGGQLTFEVDGKEYTVTRTFNEQDEFELRDAKTNLISNDYSSKLGEELFKVDRESFMRTVFIGQADCETAVTDDINAKIGNLTDNSNDLNSFELASARLKDLLNSLTPNRKTGSISQRKNEITELDRKVVAQRGIPEALQKLQEKRSEELQAYNQLKAQLETLQNEQIRLSNLQRTLAKKEQWENLKRELQEAQEQFASLQQAQEHKEKKVPLLLIGGILVAALGLITMLALSVGVGIGIMAVGVLVVVAGIFDNRKRSVSEEAEQLRQTIFGYLEDKKRKLETFEKETDISCLQVEIEMEKPPCLSELNERFLFLSNEREVIYTRLEAYQADIEQLQIQMEEWEENKIRLEELKEIQSKEQQKYNHMLKVQEYLAKAKESITNRYAAPILESFSKYYEMITSTSADEFRIDANTNITIVEQGKQRETNTQSSGYRDLIGICLRVALVDAMYKEEEPVLILDDPFTNLDDEKMKQAKKFLEYVAQKYQVIYFTCSESRK